MQQGNNAIREIQFPNEQFLPEVIKLLNEGHTATIRLRGFSMRPFLEDNRDKALLAKPTTYNVGDPVLAEISKGHFVLHRIIGIDKDNDIVTLRGDGNIANETCRQKDVKAIVIGFYRKGRDKIDLVTDKKWRTYSAIWTRLYPIRRYLLFIYRHVFL